MSHSCVIVTLVLKADGSLDPDKTIVNTKNGLQPQVQTTLAAVMATYLSSTWVFYTRK